MNPASRSLSLSSAALLLLGIAGPFSPAAAVAGDDSPAAPAARRAASEERITDAPLESYRVELLELAFDAASAMPDSPHIKNKAREQDGVVAVCLELDQPRRALRCVEQIGNWRKGTGYADYALYCAEHGDASQAREHAGRALAVAEALQRDPEELPWRVDRIRAKVARVHAVLGDDATAAGLEADLVPSEAGKVEVVRAARADEADFDRHVAALEQTVASGHFDLIQNQLAAACELFDRFYDDTERRARLCAVLDTAWSKVPTKVCFETLTRLAESAVGHGDGAAALELAKQAQVVRDGVQWSVEQRVPLMAQLAVLRFRAGDETRARREADAALELFESKGDEIFDVFRPETLQPLAAAYQTMGDTASALAVYKLAVEEGAKNPNSRPRAEDLSATARSMALHGVEPDEALWSRMRAIREGLGDPW